MSARRRLLLALPAAGAFLAACGSPSPLPPAGQLVLYVDTDAPLPGGDGRPRAPLDPAPLFDRIRVEGMRSDGTPCKDCTREVDLTREILLADAVSFGVFPPLAGGGTLRVRMFR